MESATVASLEGVQTLSKLVPPKVATFSTRSTSGGSAVIFAPSPGERSPESVDAAWLSEPPSQVAVPELCQDEPLELQESGADRDPHESDDVVFALGSSDEPDHVTPLAVGPAELGPDASLSGCAEGSCQVSATPSSLEERSRYPAVSADLKAQGTACAIAADSAEEPVLILTLSHLVRSPGLSPAASGHQGEHDERPHPTTSLAVHSDCPALSRPSPTCPEAPGPPSPGLWELPLIVRHKPSSIAFSDYSDCCRGRLAGRGLFVAMGPDSSESSSEDNNDDDDDDVFPELPQCREFLAGRRRRGELNRSGLAGGRDGPHSQDSTCNGRCETEEGSGSMEECPPILSPWPDSMTQLMKKLDQLNLDIEEALSSGSSPSHTPSVSRKRPPDAASGTAVKPTLKENGALRSPDPEECREQESSSSPNHTSPGIRAGPKKTEVAVKMDNEGADPDQAMKLAAGMTTA